MRRPRRTLLRAFVLLTIALLSSAPPAHAGGQAVNGPAWPPPPAKARIRFLRTVEPALVRPKPSVFSRLLTALVGSEAPPRMSQPYGVAIGPSRRIYVADSVGGRIHVFDLEKPSYASIKIDAASLIGVAFLGERMYVTDSVSGRLICLDQKGRTIWSLGRANGFERPTGITAGPDRLYVVDTARHQVVVVGPNGGILRRFGSRGDGPGQFNFPTNVARGADGRIYVTDSMNFRVQVFDADGRPEHLFGRLGDSLGEFSKPKGVAVDSNGHIYVVEGLNDIVQIFDDAGRLLLAFGGSGLGDGQLWLPSGIAIVNDIVYVADSANHRVQMFEYVREDRR